MRATTVFATAGGVAAVGATTWYALAEEGAVTAAPEFALAIAAGGLLVAVAALLVAWRRRGRIDAVEHDEPADVVPDVLPTIIVRRHGRPRPPRVATAAASSWHESPADTDGGVVQLPVRRHPSMTQ